MCNGLSAMCKGPEDPKENTFGLDRITGLTTWGGGGEINHTQVSLDQMGSIMWYNTDTWTPAQIMIVTIPVDQLAPLCELFNT
ncbi:hypothetical protein ACTXT7_013214 [Hymenolepis weldensis]